MSVDVLKVYMQENGLSQSQVAAQIGVSAAVVNQYLQGKYGGNVEKIDEAVGQLISRQAEKAKSVKTDFVATPTARRILEVCGLAQALSDVYLVIGDAGMGKTMALKEYARTNANVLLIETDPSFTAKVMLQEICQGLSLTPAKNIHSMMTAIVDKLKGSEKLIIIDEAELLAYKPLEILRRIHDKTGVGMVLAGMPKLRVNLRGANGEFKQLYSRVGLALDVRDCLPAEDVGLLCEAALGTGEFNELFFAVSRGNARRLSKLLRGVHRVSTLRKQPISQAMIEQFAKMLID